jgi:hypothetical protein
MKKEIHSSLDLPSMIFTSKLLPTFQCVYNFAKGEAFDWRNLQFLVIK